MKQLIVGIDPGTTTGVALLDLDGNIVLLRSGKGFSKSGLEKMISERGNPVIIATDINPPPRIIKKISATFSARIMYPEQSLSRKEKIRIAHHNALDREGKPVWANHHERDSLAAVFFAWAKIRPLMKRVEKRFAESGMRGKELRQQIKANVLLSGNNIKSCLSSGKAVKIRG